MPSELFNAISGNDTQKIIELIDKRVNLYEAYTDQNGLLTTPLSYALLLNHTEIVKLLVHRGKFDVNFQVNQPPHTLSWTALHQASYLNTTEMMEFLLNNGANVNCTFSDAINMGWTPLHLMAHPTKKDDNNSISAALLLLNRGANLCALNNQGQTPRSLALLNDKPLLADAMANWLCSPSNAMPPSASLQELTTQCQQLQVQSLLQQDKIRFLEGRTQQMQSQMQQQLASMQQLLQIVISLSQPTQPPLQTTQFTSQQAMTTYPQIPAYGQEPSTSSSAQLIAQLGMNPHPENRHPSTGNNNNPITQSGNVKKRYHTPK